MSKIDWSLAPEDATHARDYKRGMDFYKREGGLWLYWDRNKWDLAVGTSERDCVERPKPKQWSGPEDGLPPVGVEVDFDYRGCPQGSGKVLFYGSEFCVVQNTTGGAPYEQVALIEDYSFNCLHEASELATKNRESAIRELMDIAQVDCRVTAARLVDAGFKR